MEALYKEYKARDLVVIGVDILEREDKARQFAQQGGYSWTFVIDTTGGVTRNYGITSYPRQFLPGQGRYNQSGAYRLYDR